MPLKAGSRLGPYEIVSPLGAGGMGEVYKARDTRLDRSVAVKVLPPAVASDPAFLERFEREARAVSSLSHPNICALYDVGEEAGVRYIVMELLEGETVASRLTRGPLPLDEALRYGVQIADALSRVHKQGFIHRDLKPGNVMITRSGAKLLDFGLARADAVAAAASGVTMSPTQEQNLTAAGTILGTFQYMAPEQLEGREADARTDIFAFGALLYEMVTGKTAFSGSSQASLIASIMSSIPSPVSQVQPLAPPALDRVLKLCLAKDPDDRWQTAQDLAAELKWIAEGGSQVGAPVAVVSRRRSRERIAWMTAGAFALLAVVALIRVFTTPVASLREPTRFAILAPKGIHIGWPRISPDGRAVAFVGTDAQGVTSIWIRRMDSRDVVRLSGTEGVLRPFWSPDSKYLAFFASGQLKKVAAAGGPPQLICEQPGGADGTWSPVGVILFDGSSTDNVRRVADSGGVPTAITKTEGKEVGTAWPFFLPDGHHFLYVGNGSNGPVSLKIGSIDNADTTVLMPVESRVEYSSGHVFYVSQQTLMARPFSPEKRAFTGEPFPVTDRIQMQQLGRVDFSLSRNGDLTFISNAKEPVSKLLWVDRAGHEAGTIGEAALFREMALSPDGRQLAVAIDNTKGGSNYDVWVIDLRRGTRSRLTFGNFAEGFPVWSPDGQWIAYAGAPTGRTLGIYRKLASGAGAEVPVASEKGFHDVPTDWSRDGKTLLAESITASGDHSDIVTIAMDGTGTISPFIRTPKPLSQGGGRFSPDGRWVAYTSTESGRPEVYVQSFPPSGGKWQISTTGGYWPVWRADGKEIIYVTPDDTFYAVSVSMGGGKVDAGEPVKLFQRHMNRVGSGARGRFVVTADGQRFIVNAPVEDVDLAGADVVLDWANGLTRK